MKNKRENIAEYILYLWQLEDYLRAFPEQAETNAELHEIHEMMHREGITDSGHLRLAQNALQEMEQVHAELLDQEAQYRAMIIRVQPALNILKSKTDRPTMSDVEACLILLYQIMMLRLQQKPVSEETAAVQQQATRLLQIISRAYYDNQTAL
jgi:hypothetical protein